MNMDPNFKDIPEFDNEICHLPGLTDFESHKHCLINYSPPLDPDLVTAVPNTNINSEGGWSDEGILYAPNASVIVGAKSRLEGADFAEAVKFINQIIVEDNIQEKPCVFYDPLSPQVSETSFYHALLKNYPHPPSPNQHHLYIDQNVDNSCLGNLDEYQVSSTTKPSLENNSFQLNPHSISQNPTHPQEPLTDNSDAPLDISMTELLAQSIFTDKASISEFKKGLEEASKFLPKGIQLFTGPSSSILSPELNGETETEKAITNTRCNSAMGLKSRKNHEREYSDSEEWRGNKQSAVFIDESESSAEFDKLLLEKLSISAESESRESGTRSTKAMQANGGVGGKSRFRKQAREKEIVDLENLLLLCARAVSANEITSANELLRQIRKHSSPNGDGLQRVTHFFANGLEARLVGADTGTQIFYTTITSNWISAVDMLKAYRTNIAACPFKKFSILFANKMILKVAEKATSLHRIDFGILHGFQWPTLIKDLSNRAGGPPKLRITGIEFPHKGFRPAQRIEETGRRLANYCKRFNVPFEFKAIAAQNWEAIPIEEFEIEVTIGVLAVNCLFRFKNLLDETVEMKCPKDVVLRLIRKMNPNIWVQTILNGSHNAPFFLTRFKEALYYYSALYDMFDTIIPREKEERLWFEREFYGREAMNVKAYGGLKGLRHTSNGKLGIQEPVSNKYHCLRT